MENAENGASQLTLPTDVNENTETSISCCGPTIDAPECNVGADKNARRPKNYDERRLVEYGITGSTGFPQKDGEFGNVGNTMLGLVAKGGKKNNFVNSDRHIDTPLNHTAEAVGRSMVESTAGGRVTSTGRSSGVADDADCPLGSGEALNRDSTGKDKRNTERNLRKDALNSNQSSYSTPCSSLPCERHGHEEICRCQASPQPPSLTLRNGNMNGTDHLPIVREPDRGSEGSFENANSAKMVNGEIAATEHDKDLKASPQSGVAEAILSNPLVENPSAKLVPQSSCTACGAAESNRVGQARDDSVFIDTDTFITHHPHGVDSVPRVELSLGSDTANTVRPQSLRSLNHSTHFLSCDSTPLSPERSSAFLRPGTAAQDLSFMDVNLNSRNTFETSRRQSAPDHMPGVMSVSSGVAYDQMAKHKKHGISDFFGRGFFQKKLCEQQSAPGWKLFGKVPPRENNPKDSRTIQQDSSQDSLTSVSTPSLLGLAEYEAKRAQSGHSPPSLSGPSGGGRRKNLEFEPLSTTALILEDRPANLPAKSTEEAQRHRQEYDEMVAEAKKRELKEAQRKKKMMKERFKQEESIASAMLAWNNEILPNWESMRGTRRVRELWWQGLPPNVRGKVWSLAIGNELNITPELYEIFLSRAKERWKCFSETGAEPEAEADLGAASLADRESSLDVIKLDISRTFPSLFIFQKGGPYHDVLHSVLGAYTCYRPDVGYVQGMSFIAAVLILNLEEPDAFIAFANLLNKPCQMAFFRVDHELMMKYFAAFEVFFEENLPRLFSHFKSCSLTPDLYLIDWIFTLYSRPLPLDVACRVWDVFCRDGEEFLFRTALGILRLFEDVLLQMDFIHMAQFLTRLPDQLPSDPLFACIAATQMLSGNRKWAQVFSTLMKDSKEMEKSGSPAMKAS